MPTDVKYPKIVMDAKLKAQLLKLSEENLDALEAVGFPRELIPAFLETANQYRTILMSRDPGFAGLKLISEKYDLKGFHIKSKSCNWGPMAGFVCKLPPFNKSGMDKYEYNIKNTTHYLEELSKKDKNGIDLIPDAWEREKPWEHIKITEDRRKNLFSKEGLWPTLRCNSYTKIEVQGNILGYYGITEDKSKTVQSEYILLKEELVQGGEFLWGLYHGTIQIKDKKNSKYRDYKFKEDTFELPVNLRQKKKEFLLNITELGQQMNVDSLPDEFSKIRAEIEDNPFKNSNADFYEIQAITNPYPPNKYVKVDDARNREIVTKTNSPSYLHCVTGDFDLFAFWPFENINANLVRNIEGSFFNKNKYFSSSLKVALNNSINKSSDLVQFLKKQKEGISYYGSASQYEAVLTLDSPDEKSTINLKENIIIEFIPVNKQLLSFENIHFGNIHHFGQKVAQTLNSIASSVLGFSSNMALHSDEGGRPFIVEIDFPIGYFLPPEMNFEENPFGLCGTIKDIYEFLDFVLLVNNPIGEVGILIYLNQGWYLDLILNALNKMELTNLLNLFNAQLQTKGKSSNIYCTDIKEKIEEEINKFPKKDKIKFAAYRKKITHDFLGFKAPMNTQFYASDAYLVNMVGHFLDLLVDLYLLKDNGLKNVLNSFGNYTPDKKDFISINEI